jgi:hypothetical protein
MPWFPGQLSLLPLPSEFTSLEVLTNCTWTTQLSTYPCLKPSLGLNFHFPFPCSLWYLTDSSNFHLELDLRWGYLRDVPCCLHMT